MPTIWNESDGWYMRPFKLIFFFLACITFAWWVLPIRNFCRQQKWRRATWMLNNIPNGLSILRGVASLVVVPFFTYNVWRGYTDTATAYFLIIVGLFLLDAIDGPLARMLNHLTQFGAKVDPAADKVLIYSLALVMPFITWHLQGVISAIVVTVFLGWMGFVEQRIVAVSLRANTLSSRTGIDLHGAYGPGKAKFVTQTIGFAAVYAFLIWNPQSVSGVMISSVLFLLARWFADKSLGYHRRELIELERSGHDARLRIVPEAA